MAVSLSGTGNGPPARRIRFSGNTLTGGGMGGVNARDVTISGNVIEAAPTGQVLAFRGIDGLSIQGNRISAAGSTRTAISLSTHDNVESSRIRITDNDIGGVGGSVGSAST